MPEVPKIVYDRLRAGSPGGTVPEAPHPDPDMLTAFAEKTLSAAEREGVLQHLARCGDCRELVALSIPAVQSNSPPVAAEETESAVSAAGRADGKAGGHWSWFAWPGLRWAALAAGIAVAGGILLIHPGKPNAVPGAKQQAANVVTPQPEKTIVAKEAVPAPMTLNDKSPEKKSASAGRAFSRDEESKLAYPAAAPANALRPDGQRKTQTAAKDLAVGAVVSAAVSAAPTSPAPAPPIPASSEMVAVTAESAEVTTEEARTDHAVNGRQAADLPMSGRNVFDLMVITKAKAAKTESNEPSSLQQSESLDKKQATTDTTTQQQLSAAKNGTVGAYIRPNAGKADFPQPVQIPTQWTIHENELQRSLDAGVAWKTVLHSDRPLLCYAASGNDIWAGGKAGNLFHSADGGVTWNVVHPSSPEQTLAEDVAHIDLYSPSHVDLLTSNNQSWSTTDGGKTWVKK